LRVLKIEYKACATRPGAPSGLIGEILMRDTMRLFAVVGQAALLFTAACFLLTMVSFAVLLPASTWTAPLSRMSSVGEAVMLAIVLLVPAGLSRWWIFRKLLTEYSRREARSVANAFALLAPVLLAISLVLSPIVGGYAGVLLGTQSRFVAFASAMAGVAVMVTLMTFALSTFVLWFVRRIIRAER
jgi:hypothetical protein